jgi:spore coat-associated protein N
MRGKRQAPTSRWTITFGVTLIALGVLSFNAWASFSSAVSTSHAVGSGTLVLDLTPNNQVNRLARAYDASDVAPGDTMQRALDLNSSGTVAMSSVTLATTATTSSLLDTGGVAPDPTKALQIQIDKCSVDWTEGGVGPAYTYTCGGATSSVLASRTIIMGATTLNNINLSGTNHLMVTITFPSGDNDTFQNQSSVIQYTFAGVQRAGTDK